MASTQMLQKRTSTQSTLPLLPPLAHCTSVTCSAIPTPTSLQGSRECAVEMSSIRWVGMTMVFQPSAGFRTTTGCVATPHFPTKKTSLPLRLAETIRAPRQQIKCRSQGKTSLSSAKSSPRRTSKLSRTFGATLGSLSTGRRVIARSARSPSGSPSRHF